MKIISFLFFAWILLVTIYSCNTTEPPDDSKLTLTVEDVSCTEAWLTLAAENVQLPAEISIKRTDPDGNSISQISILTTQDSLLYIDSLLPNKTYSFQAILQTNSLTTLSSKTTATTMDTTSHNFAWETFTFGGGGEASFINDVAIIDENNIWACGEIYLPDSLGNPDNNLYNAIHWDGNNWVPKRISVEFRGNIITLPLDGVFAFSANDIWFVGSLPIHGDGENWEIFDIRTTTDPNLSVSKAWGRSSDNIYFVGRTGSIAYYNGQGFSKIESGTRTYIADIWGIEKEDDLVAYCPVSDLFQFGDRKILRINDNKVDSISWNLDRLLNGVWTDNNKYLYVCGWGVFENRKGFWNEIDLPQVTYNGIRGNGQNDIFTAGDYGTIAHFNGLSWKVYNNSVDAGYGEIEVNGNLVAVTGQRNGKGIITVGKRN